MKLLTELSQDPQLRAAVQNAKLKYQERGKYQVDDIRQLVSVILRVGSKFFGRQRSRVLAEAIDAMTLIVDISLIVKANVFDRPEVKKFFGEFWSGLKVNSGSLVAAGREIVRSRLKK